MNSKTFIRRLALCWIFAATVFIYIGCSASNLNTDSYGSYRMDGVIKNDAGTKPNLDTGIDADPIVNQTDSTSAVMPIDASEDGACKVTGSEAVPIVVDKEVEVPVEVPQPVALYIMLDHSLSMLPDRFDAGTGPSKWQIAYDSVTAFVNDPASKDLDVALQYFPIPPTATDPDDAGVTPECQASLYSTPDVPMGRLPSADQATKISDSLTAHTPVWPDFTGAGTPIGTPMEPALQGAVDFCAQFMNTSTTGEKCVVVLITDGKPEILCNLDGAVIAGIAGTGFQNTPKVKTFAIGMKGADFTLLNNVGQQGGTDCTPNEPDGGPPQTYACDVSSGMTLLKAFELIREFVTEKHVEIHKEIKHIPAECQWEIPPPPPYESFDRDKVNIEFSATGLVTDKKVLTRVDSKDKCGSELSWYYDDPKEPKQLIACPDTCSAIKGADLGKIRVLFGCKVVVAQ